MRDAEERATAALGAASAREPSYQLAGALGTETAAAAAAGAVTAILEEAVRGFVVAAAVLTLLTGFAVARSDFETAVA
jgi:hypothetical protein